jgi:transglutaminase-like putative cysteine protease
MNLKIRHLTRYLYSQPVSLLPHTLHIRPRVGHDIRIVEAFLTVTPPAATVWQRDLYGNSVAILSFGDPASELGILSEVTVVHYEASPLNFLIDPAAVQFPFQYEPRQRIALMPYEILCYQNDEVHLRDWLAQFWQSGRSIQTYELLDNINKAIARDFTYQMREEPGVQRPADTIRWRAGSCRDFATLFMESARFFGLAARFVSGYLYCPETVQGHGSTHAWSEVFLPGAGWIAFDSTSGQVVGTTHIATAVSRHPEYVPPVSGSFLNPGGVACQMLVEVDVSRILET